MNRILQKLRSRKGASITFALLLFLVCAVLSSVMIAAATAAAGRMSGLAENDRRYYGVTSAAGLMKDLIDGRSVTITRVTVQDSTQHYKDDEPVGDPSPADGDLKEYLGEINNENQISVGLYGTQKSILNDAAYDYYTYRKALADGGMPDLPEEKTLTLTLEAGDASVEGMIPVTITESIDGNGKMTVTLSAESEGKVFRQQLVFTANVTSDLGFGAVQEKEAVANYSEWEETTGEGQSAVTTIHNEYDSVTTTTITETFTVTWTLSDVKTEPEA